MFELNEIGYEKKPKSSLFYKISKTLLITLSSVIMFYYLVGVVGYVVSGPSITLTDDLTTEFVVQVVLMGLGLLFLITAWFKPVSYGIVAFVYTCFYVAYMSIQAGSIAVGFLAGAMAANAAGFIVLGLARKHRKKNEFNVYAEPIVDELEGPDIFNFKV